MRGERDIGDHRGRCEPRLPQPCGVSDPLPEPSPPCTFATPKRLRWPAYDAEAAKQLDIMSLSYIPLDRQLTTHR